MTTTQKDTKTPFFALTEKTGPVFDPFQKIGSMGKYSVVLNTTNSFLEIQDYKVWKQNFTNIDTQFGKQQNERKTPPSPQSLLLWGFASCAST